VGFRKIGRAGSNADLDLLMAPLIALMANPS
jgi:hypothetical protein